MRGPSVTDSRAAADRDDAIYQCRALALRLAGDVSGGRDAAGLLVAAALVVLVEARNTPGDAARMLVEGIRRGLRSMEPQIIRCAVTLRGDG